ncbi:MAG TPA: ATP synthase F1 subunit delta, partial [Chitinophagaceae bacterium]|nr:ATP synthase F1 subunit delta [Chitinophagaceae bacterium]
KLSRMPNPRLATRYAKSLIDLAIEKDQLEVVFADMKWLQAVCKSSREFVNVLRSPIITADKKEKIIDAVTSGNIGEMTKAFSHLMIRKGRESNLPEVAAAFITQYKAKKNIYTIKLTTASALSDDLKNAIVNQIKSTSNMQNIELETTVNENLIGGFVLQAGDKLIDASIAYDLKNIAKQFDNNDFIYKIR